MMAGLIAMDSLGANKTLLLLPCVVLASRLATQICSVTVAVMAFILVVVLLGMQIVIAPRDVRRLSLQILTIVDSVTMHALVRTITARTQPVYVLVAGETAIALVDARPISIRTTIAASASTLVTLRSTAREAVVFVILAVATVTFWPLMDVKPLF
jgi:hypothetical protein